MRRSNFIVRGVEVKRMDWGKKAKKSSENIFLLVQLERNLPDF